MMAVDVSGLQIWGQAMQTAAIAIGLVLAVLLTVLTGDTLRRLGPEKGALIPKDGLPLREMAPAVKMSELRTGEVIALHSLQRQQVVIVFLSEQCVPCRDLEPCVRWVAERREHTRFIAVVDEGTGERYFATLGDRVTVVEDIDDRGIARAFKVRRMPLVYVIDGGGLVAIRAVTNTRLELEDALDGAGHMQDTEWVPVASGR